MPLSPHRQASQLRPGAAGTSAHAHAAYARARDGAARALLAGGLPYARKLSAHRSCVNALAFSRGDSRWLASGGDDQVALLWDFHQADLREWSTRLEGPRSNIFAMDFSASTRYFYMGDVESVIYKYDMEEGVLLERIQQHRESVRGISCHPHNDEIVVSCSEDGTIVMRDWRAGSSMTMAQGTIQQKAEVTDVRMHPTMEHHFVTSDGRGAISLRDTRMAFGPLRARTNEGIVQRYVTTLSKPSARYLANPEVSSVAFDREGAKLAVTFMHYYPTIYAVGDPVPLAVCSGRNLPDGSPVSPGERTYENSATIKHGSFGGPGLDHDEYYAAGSSDFRAYVWKVPDLPLLASQRQEHSLDKWNESNDNTIAFAERTSGPRHEPVELSTPLCRLNGHTSIVNTALFHPQQMHIATSGIEHHVILHSPTPSSSCTQDLPKSPTVIREIPPASKEDETRYLRALVGVPGLTRPEYADNLRDVDRGDWDSVQLFDYLIREESSADLFKNRHWRGYESDDSDDEDDSEDTGANGEE